MELAVSDPPVQLLTDAMVHGTGHRLAHIIHIDDLTDLCDRDAERTCPATCRDRGFPVSRGGRGGG